MPIDALSYPDQTRITGPLSLVNDPAASQSVAQVLVANSAIIVPAGCSSVKISSAGAIGGVTLPVGVDGQLLFIIQTSSFVITFAAVGTSNVFGGTSITLNGLNAHLLRYDGPQAAWFVVGPAAN